MSLRNTRKSAVFNNTENKNKSRKKKLANTRIAALCLHSSAFGFRLPNLQPYDALNWFDVVVFWNKYACIFVTVAMVQRERERGRCHMS